MKRRLNHTGRQEIAREHVPVTVRPFQGDEVPVFDMELKLASYDFPADARVRVDAWRSNAVQRWDCGTVGDLNLPGDEERVLTEVPVSAQFRVLVVAGDGSGLLLGHAPKIQPVLPRESLLPVRESEDLGAEVWRVDFGDGLDRPELLINRSVDGISEVVRHDEVFRALVMPSVLRTILVHIAMVEMQDPADEEGPWAGWFELARALEPDDELPRITLTSDESERAEVALWIDKVVANFSEIEQMDAANSYNKALRSRGR